jgi:Zinc-binding domain of primase-helicase
MNATPPCEFSTIGLRGEFRKYGANEWHGECPNCGGDDRFVIFTDKPFPKWNWFCRQCHPESGWIDELNPALREELSPSEKARRAAEYARLREESLKREIERAQEALKELQSAQSWLRYHEQMTDEARQQWESWGIPDFWQEFWKLGFDPDRIVWSNKEQWHTPTMTIPIFAPATWEVLNVRHRLLNPPRPGDKYRPEKSGLPAALFIADPDEPVSNKTLLVEGEKKSMVSFITADDPTLQVVGIPGKNPPKELLEQLNNCDPLYICLDPDATPEAHKVALSVGADRCRLIELPDKIDDLILKYQLDNSWMRRMMRQAVKV